MKFFTGLFFSILILGTTGATAQVEDAPEDIKKFISAEEKAKEVPVEINKLIYGDINGDKIKDAVIQYNVQIGYPGNNFLSYIAVFLKKNGKHVFTARMENGAKLSTVLVPSSVKSKVIIFDKYGENGFDKIGTVKYKLAGSKLVKTR
jgi:hypothetical protein